MYADASAGRIVVAGAGRIGKGKGAEKEEPPMCTVCSDFGACSSERWKIVPKERRKVHLNTRKKSCCIQCKGAHQRKYPLKKEECVLVCDF